MTSEKSYDNAQRIDALVPRVGTLEAAVPLAPGPYTTFTLANGWSRTGGWTWTRWFPGNMCFFTCHLIPGTDTDGTQVGTVASADSLGNPLRPAQQVTLVAACDVPRNAGTASEENAYFTVTSAGAIFCHGFAGAATIAEVHIFYPIDAM